MRREVGLRLDLSFSDSVAKRDLAGAEPWLRAALKVFESRVAWEGEWAETCAILGGTPTSVALHFCDDVEMRAYHRQFRKLDRTTDVLSFPSREAFAGLVVAAGEGPDRPLGDMIVSLETVRRASARARRPFREELLEVFLHGCLHLCGYDHVGQSRSAREAALRMRRLQRELCAAAGLRSSIF